MALKRLINSSVLLLLVQSKLHDQRPVNLAQLQYYERDGAADMNAYKLYNLEQSDRKSAGKVNNNEGNHDKKTMQEAEEMIDGDEITSTPREEIKAQQQNVVAGKPTSVFEQVQGGESTPSQDSATNVQSEEDNMQQNQAAVLSSVGDKQIKIGLSTTPESLYLGTIYVGSQSKAVRVILDTGSEHLAIASDLCEKCPNKPYSLQQSTSKKLLSNDTKSVLYGSAKFEGKETQDKTCLAQGDSCINFKFLSLQKGEGLDANADGILGLSPEMSTDRQDQHLVWSLMKQKLVSKAAFSLSLSDSNMFAIIGGIDENQIVGGIKGLKPFRNNPDIFSHIKAWALSGKGVFMGPQQVGQKGTFPAVIDTGSTFIAVPPPLFAALQQQWQLQVKDLDCKSDPNFCESKEPCSSLEATLKPVGFLIGGAQSGDDSVFEISASQYLFQAEGKCQFAIAENKLDKFNNGNFIFGQLFLKHFYTVYNYENEQISLGINVDSKDQVRMYSPGQGGATASLTQIDQEDEPKVIDV